MMPRSTNRWTPSGGDGLPDWRVDSNRRGFDTTHPLGNKGGVLSGLPDHDPYAPASLSTREEISTGLKKIKTFD